jgi:hypothetical protein
MTGKANAPLLVGSVVADVSSAILAWRDLSRRTDQQVRGKKNLWRAVISIHPGNSLVYWAFGRR